jgi:hypothetical protein
MKPSIEGRSLLPWLKSRIGISKVCGSSSMQKPVSTQHSWLTKLGVGDLVGGTVGIVDGLTVIGFLVGDFVGKRVGGLVGSDVGFFVLRLGTDAGFFVGALLGLRLGTNVGFCVGG